MTIKAVSVHVLVMAAVVTVVKATPAAGSTWSILDQVSVATISDTAILHDTGASTDPMVAVVVTVAAGASQRDGDVAFKQRMLVLRANTETDHWTKSNTDLRLPGTEKVTQFCDFAGDCSTPKWCTVSKASTDSNHIPRLTFIASNSSQHAQVFYSDCQNGTFSAPKPLWMPIGESSNQDVVYGTPSEDCTAFAFTYAETRRVDDTVREVGEDVLIDVIQNSANSLRNHLCTVQVQSPGEANHITCHDEPGTVGMAGWLISCWSHPSQFSFPPGSSTELVFTHTKNMRANDWADTDQPMGWTILDMSAGKAQITHSTDDGRLRFQPVWSNGGTHVAFVMLAEQDKSWLWSQVWNICLMNVADPEAFACDSVGSPDEEPNLIGFLADDTAILYTEQHGTRVTLNMVRVGLTGPGMFPVGGHSEISISYEHTAVNAVSAVDLAAAGGQTVVSFVGESLTLAPEVYVAYISADKTSLDTVKLSSFNGASSAYKFDIGGGEATWPSMDGKLNVSGLILWPESGAVGLPVAAFAHPGPNMAHAQTYLGWGGVGARYPVATLVQMGYVVVMPNIRGSAGYGASWRTSIYQDWGGGDLSDLFAGIKYAVTELKANSSDVHVFGWSYGGYLSAMALTHAESEYHQPLASVCIGGGIVDLVSHTGTADIAKLLKNTYGGYYWEPQPGNASASLIGLYERSSAMYAITEAKAPTLLHHGAHDPRVPILQAFQLHYALQARGVETRMLVYPGSGHIPGNAEQLLNIWNSTITWIMQNTNTPHN